MRRTVGYFKRDEVHLTIALFGFAGILIVALLAVAVYANKFIDGNGLSNSQEVWGQFGDFIGGLLNPMIGALTVFLLLISVHVQRKEFRNSIAEMKASNAALEVQRRASELQNIEQTFFIWLESYREIVGGLAGREHLRERLDAFLGSKKILEELAESQRSLERVIGKLPLTNSPADEEHISNSLKDLVLREWEELYKAEAHNIAGMFRTLYQLIKWVHKQESNVLSTEKKYHFISIARAQLSDAELIYLFYNGFTERGRKFNNLINRYALFDNLDTSKNPEMHVLRFRDDCPYKPPAFNSNLAREALGLPIAEPDEEPLIDGIRQMSIEVDKEKDPNHPE